MSLDELTIELRAVLDAADTEERDLTDDEATRVDELTEEIGRLQVRGESVAAARRLLELRGDAAPYVAARRDDDTLERAFDDYLRTGRPNSDIVELRDQSVGTPTAGGYLVPPGFRQVLIEAMKAFGGLSGAAQTITTAMGNALQWPTVDDTANEGEIVAEGGTFAAGADVVYGTKTLGAYKYMAGGGGNVPLKVSVELLQDSAFDIRAYLGRALGTRIARVQAGHWVNGAGTTEPEGLVAAATPYGALTTLSTITYAELVNTVHALDPAYRGPGCAWLMNDSTLAAVRKLVDGAQRPLWEPEAQSGMMSMPGGSLLGYPIIVDQAVPDLGAGNSILAFGDFGQAYVIRRVADVQIVVLNELYAPNGQVGFMAWSRADGCVQDPNAYVVLADHA